LPYFLLRSALSSAEAEIPFWIKKKQYLSTGLQNPFKTFITSKPFKPLIAFFGIDVIGIKKIAE
jgi:hypothetical protein